MSFASLADLPDDALVRMSHLAYGARRSRKSPTLLNVHEQTIFRLVRSGQFPKPVKLGSMSLWRLGDVRAWLAAHGKGDAQ